MSNELENVAKEWATNASPSLTPSPKGMKLRIRADVETREEAFIAGANWQSQTNEQGKIGESDIKLLKELRSYFGEQDKTLRDHRFYSHLDKLINALQLPQPKGSGWCKWVKTSERLPSKSGEYIYKASGNRIGRSVFAVPRTVINEHWEAQNVIEWLDEAPPHQQQGGEKVDEK